MGAVALATSFYAPGPVVFDLAVLQTFSVMKDTVLPVIFVIMATLGVILAGIATPTDAGAVGAASVFVLTLLLIVILAVVLVLGWPLEWVPIVLPLVQAAGIDLIWFCTLVAMTLQTAWLSPPVALSAYFLKGVVPQWSLKDIYAGMVQFMVLQLLGVGLLLMFPKMATWLPTVN